MHGMGAGERDDRGTWRDWPTAVLLVGVVILVMGGVNGSAVGARFGWIVIALAGVSWAIRAGAFSPRRNS